MGDAFFHLFTFQNNKNNAKTKNFMIFI